MPDPAAAIAALARDLLDEAGFAEPPFSPEVLASFRGVKEIRCTPMVSAARLVPEGGVLVIEVNEGHSSGKRNFSANHEVIHTLMPTYSNGPIDDMETGTFNNDSEEELLCDIGAAELLLDARRLRPHAEAAGASLHALSGLAAWYGASLQATARHIAQLDVWPCALVFWEEGYRKGERIREEQAALPGLERYGGPKPKFRVRNVYRSPSFRCFIPENKSVGDQSLVARCCVGEEIVWGEEDYDFGHQSVRLYGEHYHAPYWHGGVLTRRVVSLFLPVPSRNGPMIAPSSYQIEFL